MSSDKLKIVAMIPLDALLAHDSPQGFLFLFFYYFLFLFYFFHPK